MTRKRVSLAGLVLALVAYGATIGASQGQDALNWLDKREAIEECLRTSTVERIEQLPIGVTKPKRVYFGPGALVRSAAWKPLQPNRYQGFWESYKSEIAAYVMDKLLDLHMVPPTVERSLNGVSGAVIMWIDNTRMWRDLESRKPATRYWNTQMVRMKMFDALIGNIDRNAGNILVDDNWTVYLIDHSRAFVPYKDTSVKLIQIDASLWARMKALDATRLNEALGQLVERRCIDAILARRDRMEKSIQKLVAKNGEARVYIHD